MEKKVRLLRSPRKFTDDFKRKVVKEFEDGSLSVMQLSRLYGIANQQIYEWIYKFSIFNEKGSRIVEMKDSQTAKFKELEQRIKELEQNVGQKQIKIEYLEKMIDLAKLEFNIDIKKNFATPQSNGSKKTEKK
ncbi:MAG: transposase [Fluviicola sp.]|jgi:transposase